MRAVVVLLVLGFAAIVAFPTKQSVIVGGSLAVISQYPSVAALLYSTNGNFNQACVGTIVTAKAILTAAHCVYGDAAFKWRARVGSSWANSGGSVYMVNSIAVHPSFNIRTLDYDIAILHTVASIVYSNNVQPAYIAGANYNLPDNQVVWAAGWGTAAAAAAPSEQLRHIQAWSINQYTCSSRYAIFGANVTANMFCFGWPNVGTRDQCQGDSGGPVYHNGVLVGISSWGYGCANAVYPGVNARVSRLATWIQSNA